MDSSIRPSPQSLAIGRARLWLLQFSPSDQPDLLDVIRTLVRLRDSSAGQTSAICEAHLRSIARA